MVVRGVCFFVFIRGMLGSPKVKVTMITTGVLISIIAPPFLAAPM